MGRGLPVLRDVVPHLLDGLKDRERQQPQAELTGNGAAPLARGRHPARRMRVLHRLGSDHAPWEVEVLPVELEVLLLPHPYNGLDRLLPLRAALLAGNAE